MKQALLPQHSIPLQQLTLGHQATIVRIKGNINDIQRMNMLGIRKGTQFKIVHGPGHRGAVIQVGGTRIALGKEMFEQLEIKPLSTHH
ncbi:MAG: hypothetical protein CENE_02894 [Candidatus Celerinatantimonas neptuna]|nr:MAG: hypothetical protein CENE_02894 [Candidatus Celerinatantimonas neptuna]